MRTNAKNKRAITASTWSARVSRLLIFMALCGVFTCMGLYVPSTAEATITFQSAGNIGYSGAGGSTVPAGYPASVASGDLLILIIGMKPGTANLGSVTTPNLWTAITSTTGQGGYGATLAADTGNTNIYTFSKIATGETGTLNIDINLNGANGVAWAQMMRLSKTTGEWSAAGAVGSQIVGGNVSITFASNPGVTTGDLVIGAMVIPTDITTPAQFSAEAFTQTGVTFGAVTEISEPDSTTGNDIGGFLVRAPVTAGPGTANPTMTATAAATNTNVRGPGVFIRAREAAGTPPTAGTVNVSPFFNNFTTAAPTIVTAFTDSQSFLNSCRYTTNGSTWIAGTVGGSLPNFTCTANPTGLSGSLTINMDAVSSGGTTTASPVTATVDNAGPTVISLTALSGNGRVGLSWTCTDAGVGICNVKLVRGATAPADCSGTAIYEGQNTAYADFSVVNGSTYGYRICATSDVLGNAGSPTSTATASPAATAGRGILVTCADCHHFPPGDGTRSGATGSFVGDHAKHGAITACSTCHVVPAGSSSAYFEHRNENIELKAVISGGSYTKGTSFIQTNTPTTTGCINISCHGGNNPTPVWGVGTAGCRDCHSGTITRTMGIPGGTLDPVSNEFGLAWGHKKSGRSTVTGADCIVCHLEGNFTSQATSTYHANGYIDLRDPDGVGETRITNISGASYSFTKFSTSYTAGTRSSAGQTFNNVDNILTQKFCLACHDSNGATNTSARSNNGGTGTAQMPFGGINLGANYTVVNGAMAAGGLVDVRSQLTASWSWHPVTQPKNRDFPIAAKMADPYKPTGTRGTVGTLSLGVVMNCFDCHNAPGTPLTNRTIVSHGNAQTLRGIPAVSGTPSAGNTVTLCQICHPGHYNQGGDNHGASTAFNTAADNGMTPYINFGCNVCHGSRYGTAVVRPVRAQDMHGSKVVPTGTQTKTGRWAVAGQGPIAFMRNNYDFGDGGGRLINGYTPPIIACMDGQSAETTACGRGNEPYSPGGTY